MEMSTSVKVPRIGMFATVRNRRGVIAAVEPYDGESGRLHLVHLEYKDDQLPIEERLLWETESVRVGNLDSALVEIASTEVCQPPEQTGIIGAEERADPFGLHRG